MKKNITPLLTVITWILLTINLFSGCRNSIKDATEIEDVEVSENTEYTGRGNQDELLQGLTINVKENETIDLKNIVFTKSADTETSDVTKINVYSTGSLDTLDSRNPSLSVLLGSTTLSKKNTTCPLRGKLNPGVNYLWITADIADYATEGNKVCISLTSIGYNKNKKYEHQPVASTGREILLARKLIFSPGDYDSKFYRIPSLTTANDGSLITATDKRKDDIWDLPLDIDVVIRRSTDNGQTWGDPITIAEGKGYAKGYGDPALIKLNNGKILCVYAGGSGLWQSTPDSLIRTYVSESIDNGVTWTSPNDITDQLYGAGCDDPVRKKWMGSFCASGHAIQTSTGRVMLVAAVREGSERSLNNYVFYSDDEGKTWHVSEKAMVGGDEAKVVELTDGTILMSIRNKNKGYRYYTTSTDQGITWQTANLWNDLKDPACNGDMIRYSVQGKGSGKNRLLHSIPFDEKDRKNVSVYVSYDEGKTWPVGKTICAGPSAYSALTVLNDGTIGAYVEEGTLSMNMYYLNFSLEWLTGNTDKFSSE